MKAFTHSAFAHTKTFWAKRKKPLLISSGVVLILVGVTVSGAYAYEYTYRDRIYPNISIASIPVSGLTEQEAREVVERQFQSMLDRGLTVSLEKQNAKIDLRAAGSTDPDLVFDLLDFNADQAVKEALNTRRTFRFIDHPLAKLPLSPVNISPNVTLLEDQIVASIRNAYKLAENPGEPTDFSIEIKGNDVKVQVIEGAEGQRIDTATALAALKRDTEDLSLEPLPLTMQTEARVVSSAEAEALTADITRILNGAPYTISYTTPDQRPFSWNVSKKDLATWLIPARDESGNVTVALNATDMEDWLTTVRTDINKAPQNARFVIEDGRVVEFKGSIDGVQLDESATINQTLQHLLTGETADLTIVATTVAPTITTGSVNDLGIREILGVGTSNFAGSPSNRIQNITHGADKLNGLLIPPGETLSLLEHLRPFTIEDGYLPELVIKGDEIKPEVGGGLCQIGTTTFRAAMNAGLEIAERRNHSLVVDYYNDPSNGNPGTDATIYDPAPDFKVKNDTANYMLLTTEVDLSRRELVFTFWGTSDGRKGYYTPPKVLSWSGYGATQYKETTNLAPGVERCQSPHPGATTSFDYIVERPDGTVFTHTYASTYRSLPRICLVGIGETTPPPTSPTPPPSEPPTETLEVDDVVE